MVGRAWVVQDRTARTGQDRTGQDCNSFRPVCKQMCTGGFLASPHRRCLVNSLLQSRKGRRALASQAAALSPCSPEVQRRAYQQDGCDVVAEHGCKVLSADLPEQYHKHTCDVEAKLQMVQQLHGQSAAGATHTAGVLRTMCRPGCWAAPAWRAVMSVPRNQSCAGPLRNRRSCMHAIWYVTTPCEGCCCRTTTAAAPCFCCCQHTRNNLREGLCWPADPHVLSVKHPVLAPYSCHAKAGKHCVDAQLQHTQHQQVAGISNAKHRQPPAPEKGCALCMHLRSTAACRPLLLLRKPSTLCAATQLHLVGTPPTTHVTYSKRRDTPGPQLVGWVHWVHVRLAGVQNASPCRPRHGAVLHGIRGSSTNCCCSPSTSTR